MLEVQKYLLDSQNSLLTLEETYSIKVTHHDHLPLVILNYDQINSPKSHPIVMECRGLILEKDSWDIVAKSFTRFFNIGEMLEITEKFRWSSQVRCFEKEDGSLINLFNYRNKWMISTKGSFANGLCGYSVDKTWKDLFWECFSKYNINLDNLEKDCNHVLEFCSLENKIVKRYEEPELYLLALFSKKTGNGYHNDTVSDYAKNTGFKRPKEYMFYSIKEVEQHIRKLEEEDPTTEGLVIQDYSGLRLKVKNRKYLALHKMRGNDDNLFNPKNLLPWALQDEGSELLTYFPEITDKYNEIKELLSKEFSKLEILWNETKHIEDRKEFALAIKNNNFNSLLFQMLRGEKTLQQIWLDSEDLIFKLLFKKNNVKVKKKVEEILEENVVEDLNDIF